MAMRKPAQSMPMTGVMEMMAPQPGSSLCGWVAAGITGNFAFPDDNENFGRLLDDRLIEPLHNHFVLGVELGLDPNMADRFDRGVNVALEDNNDSVSFYGGAMMNCCKGKACCVAMLHAGPEDPRDNHDERYLSDIVTTWKITDKLTSITDINFAYEESVNAKGYGIAQFLTYAINDCCTVGIRGEVWRDADGFFVAQFASNNDFIH